MYSHMYGQNVSSQSAELAGRISLLKEWLLITNLLKVEEVM
jgi:hypothetical protein